MERRMVVARADCPARRVPDGTALTIPKDTFVTITQALGGNYTVTYNGQMVRVDGTDAEKLGLEPELLSFPPPVDRSEEHTSELQSRPHLVCRLLLEKKNTLSHLDCRRWQHK